MCRPSRPAESRSVFALAFHFDLSVLPRACGKPMTLCHQRWRCEAARDRSKPKRQREA
ncbi:hypothetical protein BAUCODRAFT_299353 [Baudoinia panamericana UAMH 10762]|uniref:Uncharacterized protein n=1 Tax=Baudoinia panamericana (strain UAMH 10762) TaxID=717646 RepID=M2MZ76_BAUPA|nr:uncharacterized protein BAUCODRAFT_299353 [Baudoinia panamericana UAMH 10762]EMC91625.1 hypothetical protein BAUCODRAFT_299353 [Baudoinia panamericana UAMH 10762]